MSETMEIGNSGIKIALTSSQIELIPVDKIDVHPVNKLIFSLDNIDSFAHYIKEEGYTTPIEVIPTSNGRYQLIAGERRFLAMKQLNCQEIPAIFLPDMPENDKLEKLIFSNIMARDITPLDMARAIDTYVTKVLNKCPNHVEMACEKFDISRTGYFRYKSYLKLIPELQKYVETKDFPYSALKDAADLTEENQKLLAEEISLFTAENDGTYPNKSRLNQVINVYKNKQQKAQQPDEKNNEPSSSNASPIDYASLIELYTDRPNAAIDNNPYEPDEIIEGIYSEDEIMEGIEQFDSIDNSMHTISLRNVDDDCIDTILNTVMIHIGTEKSLPRQIHNKKQVRTSIQEIRNILDIIEKML